MSLADRSNRHVWHTPLILAQVVHTSVFLYRAPPPGFQRNTVNGLWQILHSLPNSCLVWTSAQTDLECTQLTIRRYGFSPRPRISACCYATLLRAAYMFRICSVSKVGEPQKDTDKIGKSELSTPTFWHVSSIPTISELLTLMSCLAGIVLTPLPLCRYLPNPQGQKSPLRAEEDRLKLGGNHMTWHLRVVPRGL